MFLGQAAIVVKSSEYSATSHFIGIVLMYAYFVAVIQRKINLIHFGYLM
jgi:hypothetical protein